MEADFQINWNGTKKEPFFVNGKNHEYVKTDAEDIEFDHWSNAALIENTDHKEMDK